MADSAACSVQSAQQGLVSFSAEASTGLASFTKELSWAQCEGCCMLGSGRVAGAAGALAAVPHVACVCSASTVLSC